MPANFDAPSGDQEHKDSCQQQSSSDTSSNDYLPGNWTMQVQIRQWYKASVDAGR